MGVRVLASAEQLGVRVVDREVLLGRQGLVVPARARRAAEIRGRVT